MKICLLTTTFPRYLNDVIPPFVFGLARSMVEQEAEVIVIAPHDEEAAEYEVIDGVEIHRIHYWWPSSAQGLCYGGGIPSNIRNKKWVALQFPVLEAAFLKAALYYGRDADIFNVHWTFAGLPTVLAAKLYHKPLVTHAYSAEYIPKILHPANRFLVNNSAAVISISQYTHTMVEHVVHPRQHHIIGFGVNPEKIAPSDFDRAAFRQQIGIADGEFLIFSVGRLVQRKGFHVLIEAVAKLIQQGKSVRYILAGNGPQYDSLKTQINTLGIAEKVIMTGFINDDELRYYLAAADVLVMPSVRDQTGDTEGLGIPLLEAMANKTPAVASRIGGILDIIQHGQNGLLVEPDNVDLLASTLGHLQDNIDLQEKLITNGLDLVATTFSWQSVAQRTLSVFKNVLRSPDQPNFHG